ncbi:MAG TPA: tetratricopeptide repeat protein [Candidatus Limnocylindrales bacterium]
MTEILYERYKDALRRGHVNALRGRTDEAIGAYAEAISLAPDRPLAHISRAGVLVKVGRFHEALTGYERALRLAPHDPAALGGRAETLARLGRRTDAADAFDVLSELHEAAGRTAEACDTARRALEQAESKSRRRHIEELTRILRGAVGDKAAEQALARALLVLEETAPPMPRSHPAPPPAEAAASAADTGAGAIVDGSAAQEAREAPPVPVDATALAIEAEAALDAGDNATARDRLLAAAAAHQAAGRFAAALDACYGALAVAPSDTGLHLALVDVYLARGWRALAAEKLLLLGHLIALDDDAAGQERLCSVISARFSDDPRLTAMCA